MTAARRWAALGAVVLAGCAGAPPYQPPSVETPPAWQVSQPALPFRAAVPNDGALKGEWWELFQDAQLNRLAERALGHNQSLQAALAHLDQARAQLTITSAALSPQLDLNAGAARAKISANRPLSSYSLANQSTVQSNLQLGFSVNYEADLFGRVRSLAAGARASAEQAAADLENARLVLLSDVAADYFSLRELDAEIDVVRQGIGLQQRALDFITARHDLGVASGLDLAQQQAVLDASKTQLELLQNQRAQYEHALATLTGAPAPSFALAPVIVTLTPPPLPVGLPSDVLQRRPDVASAERAVAAANAHIGVATAAYFPQILLQPSGGWDSTQLGNLFSVPSAVWSLGAALAVPLFDAGRTRAGVELARAAHAMTVANYRHSVLVAMQEVEDGIEGRAMLARASAQAEAAVRSSQRVLELANDRYSGGLDTYLDVITAQQTLLTNQRQAVQIRGMQMTTSVYLVKALGGGWQNHLLEAAK